MLALALPMTLAHVTTPLLGLVDATVIGRLGEAHLLGAVALGAVIFDFLFWSFGSLRMATAGLTAQATGAGDQREVDRALARALPSPPSPAFALVALQCADRRRRLPPRRRERGGDGGAVAPTSRSASGRRRSPSRTTRSSARRSAAAAPISGSCSRWRSTSSTSSSRSLFVHGPRPRRRRRRARRRLSPRSLGALPRHRWSCGGSARIRFAVPWREILDRGRDAPHPGRSTATS